MKITIEGTPEEIAKMLQAIESSKDPKNINVNPQPLIHLMQLFNGQKIHGPILNSGLLIRRLE